MRVLQLNDYHPARPATRGGCEVIVELIDTLLSARDFRTSLLTSQELSTKLWTALDYVHSYASARKLRAAIRECRPDVAIVHNYYHRLSPSVLGALAEASIPTVLFAHDAHLLAPNPTLTRYEADHPIALDPNQPIPHRWLTRWDRRSVFHSLLRSAQHSLAYPEQLPRSSIQTVIAPSEFLTRRLRARGYHARYLPLPLPKPSEQLERASDSFELVFAGRLEPEKGLACVIRALPKSTSWNLRIIGDGSQRAQLEALAKENHPEGRITFLGQMTRADTQAEIAHAHVLLLPSVVHENAPLVVSEAISVGTVPAVTHLGGAAELASLAPTHAVFDPLDADSINQTVRELAAAHEAGSLTHQPVQPADRTEEMFIESVINELREASGEAAS